MRASHAKPWAECASDTDLPVAALALLWLAPEHLPYLQWHWARFERGGK